MNDYTIPSSSAPFRWFTVLSGLLVLVACGVITFFFQYAVSIAPGLQSTFLALLWVGIAILWILAVFVAYKNKSSTKYVLSEQALIIEKKGWLGRGTKRLYRYDMIMSVHSESRAHGSYGSIELQVKHQHPEVKLSGVLLPDEHAERIKKMVNASRS